MKRLLKLGAITSLGSIIPILSYMALGLMHESELKNGMIYTYPYQFLFLLLAALLHTSQCKHEEKIGESSLDYGRTGALLFLLSSTVISIISILNVDSIGGYLGVKTEVGTYAYAYGLISMCLDWTAYYFADVYYYAEKDSKGNHMIFEWYIHKVVYILLTAIPYFDYKRAVIFILVTQSCVLLRLIVQNFPKKFKFSPKASLQYSLDNLAHDTLMLIIYVVGVHDMSVQSMAVLSAYNMMSSCTDTQWDVCSVVDVVVTNEYCNGTYEQNRFKVVKNVLAYGAILLATSTAMVVCSCIIFTDIDKNHLILMFLLEMSLFVPNIVTYVWTSWYVMAYPTPLIFIVTLLKYLVRFGVQIFVVSIYSVSWGVMVAIVFSIAAKYALYKYCRRRVKVRSVYEPSNL